ncbi:MAG: Zn-dependent hydrolase [Anaerolineae bacterium]
MLTVNAHRLLDDLADLSRIGATPDGGVHRPALSPADMAARAWFQERVEAAGLRFAQDGAGNLSAVLPCDNPQARTLLCGSHLDSVPNGGRFDGPLGTLAALEALRTIQEAGLDLPVHLEAIAFTDEEGAHHHLLGSRALTGLLPAEELPHPHGRPKAFQAGLERAGLTFESILSAARSPETLAGYVELHIEQGRRLEQARINIGAVTAIVGIRSFWLTFTGQAAHAGTTPVNERQDALRGAAEFVLWAQQMVIDRFLPGTVNCGIVETLPGAFNIVPGRVRLALEFRHDSADQLDAMQKTLLALAQDAAQVHDLHLAVTPLGGVEPATFDEVVVQAIERAAGRLGLTCTRLLSFAGHDAQNLSRITPAAMIFVPSVEGISHNPAEFTRDKDVINGANTLLHTLLILAENMAGLADSAVS